MVSCTQARYSRTGHAAFCARLFHESCERAAADVHGSLSITFSDSAALNRRTVSFIRRNPELRSYIAPALHVQTPCAPCSTPGKSFTSVMCIATQAIQVCHEIVPRTMRGTEGRAYSGGGHIELAKLWNMCSFLNVPVCKHSQL